MPQKYLMSLNCPTYCLEDSAFLKTGGYFRTHTPPFATPLHEVCTDGRSITLSYSKDVGEG